MSEILDQATGVQGALAEDLANAFAFPATYVNRFFFSGMGPNIRLTFAEQNIPAAGPSVMRSAVVMSVGDAVALRDLLAHMLRDVKEIALPQSEANG